MQNHSPSCLSGPTPCRSVAKPSTSQSTTAMPPSTRSTMQQVPESAAANQECPSTIIATSHCGTHLVPECPADFHMSQPPRFISPMFRGVRAGPSRFDATLCCRFCGAFVAHTFPTRALVRTLSLYLLLSAATFAGVAVLAACDSGATSQSAEDRRNLEDPDPVDLLLDSSAHEMISLTRTVRGQANEARLVQGSRLVRRHSRAAFHADGEFILVMTDDEQVVRWRVGPRAIDRWTLGQWTPVYRAGDPSDSTESHLVDAEGRPWTMSRLVSRAEGELTISRAFTSEDHSILETFTFPGDGSYEERIEVEHLGLSLTENRRPVRALGSGGR